MVTDAHDELVMVDPGIEVVMAIAYGTDDRYDFGNAHETHAILEYFPYLAGSLENPPQSTCELGLTFVTGPDCEDCEAIEAALEAAPDGLPVHIIPFDDRLVRVQAIGEAPYLVAFGGGMFKKSDAYGDDVLSAVPDLIDKACGWTETC